MRLEKDITTEMGEIQAEAKPVIYGIKCYKKQQSSKKELKRKHYKSIKAIFDVHKLKVDLKRRRNSIIINEHRSTYRTSLSAQYLQTCVAYFREFDPSSVGKLCNIPINA